MLARRAVSGGDTQNGNSVLGHDPLSRPSFGPTWGEPQFG